MLTATQLKCIEHFADDLMENATRFNTIGVVVADTLESQSQATAIMALISTYAKGYTMTSEFLKELILGIEY